MNDTSLKEQEIDWLAPLADQWLRAEERGRLPHAVLLAGAAGVGKRATACWMAERRLGIGRPGRRPGYPARIPEHADLHWLTPPEDKRSILIDQVRELVSEISLTSYEGSGKVAVIDPADALTGNAANSLLKTLEEPPGDTLMVLIADRIAGLPATIFSRCQRLTIPIPAEDVSLAWLARLQPGTDWLPALRVAGHLPLAAVGAREHLDEAQAMSRALVQLAEHRVSPLAVAAKWAGYEPAFVLAWLGRQVQQCIHRLSGSAGPDVGGSVDESVLKRMDRRNLFCYLDSINRLRNQPPGSYNVQLTLEGLLIDWAGGLVDCRHSLRPGWLAPLPDGR